MVMEQIANLSTRKCCLGSNPSLSATYRVDCLVATKIATSLAVI